MFEPVLKELWQHLTAADLAKLTILYSISMALQCFGIYSFSRIEADQTWLILHLLNNVILAFFISKILRTTLYHISLTLTIRFRSKVAKVYGSLTKQSQVKINVDTLGRYIDRAASSFEELLAGCVDNVVEIAQSYISIILILKERSILLLIPIIYLFGLWFLVRPAQQCYKEFRDKRRPAEESLNDQRLMALARCKSTGNMSPVMQIQDQMSRLFIGGVNLHLGIHMAIQIVACASYLPLLWKYNSENILLLFQLVSFIAIPMNSLAYFATRTTSLLSDYDDFLARWIGCEVKQDLPMLDKFPEDLRASHNGIDLHLRPGSLIIVKGWSGKGKSTMLQLMIGHLPGLTWNDSICGLQLPDIVYCPQDVRSMTPKQTATVRMLFEGVAEEEIRCCLATCLLTEWLGKLEKAGRARFVELEKLLKGKLEKGIYNKLIKEQERLANTECHPFDLPIEGRISGGEHSRLGLAMTLIRPGTLYVLDEPEQGTDPDRHALLIEGIVSYIRKRSEGARIVMATHAKLEKKELLMQLVEL